MRVDVLYFGVLKEVFGGGQESVELAEDAVVSDLLAVLRTRSDVILALGSLAIAVNREYAAVGTVLHNGDEVALLPPVSGGLGAR